MGNSPPRLAMITLALRSSAAETLSVKIWGQICFARAKLQNHKQRWKHTRNQVLWSALFFPADGAASLDSRALREQVHVSQNGPRMNGIHSHALILNECVTGQEGMLCRSHVARGCEGCLARLARPWHRLPAPVEPPPWQLLGARLRVVFRCGTATGRPAAPNPHRAWTGTPRPHVYQKKHEFQPDRLAHVTCPQGSQRQCFQSTLTSPIYSWRVLHPPFPS